MHHAHGQTFVVAQAVREVQRIQHLVNNPDSNTGIDALPTMRDLDGLQLELDEVDRVLAELDAVRDATRSAGR